MSHVQKTNGLSPKAPALVKPPRTEPRHQHGPVKFTYALKQHSIERRPTGWFVAETVPSVTGKPHWRGPFQSIENACRAIARGLALEIVDRHTRSVEGHKMGKNDPLNR